MEERSLEIDLKQKWFSGDPGGLQIGKIDTRGLFASF
jgi:hypothetical protein